MYKKKRKTLFIQEKSQRSLQVLTLYCKKPMLSGEMVERIITNLELIITI